MTETARTPETRSIELRIPGHSRVAYVTGGRQDESVIGTIERSGGFYDRRLMELIQAILDPDSISLDIGANIGVISIAMAWASPLGRVYAFEASSSNFRNLCLSVGENTSGNVAPLHVALYDESVTLEISNVPEMAGCSFLSSSGVREGTSELVDAIPLDDWMHSSGLGRSDGIKLIKLDVEGAEVRVLRGARQTIESHRPDLLIEFNPTPIRRFFNEDPRLLAETLFDLYPSVEALDAEDGSLIPIESFEGLMERVIAGRGWVDMYCHF